MADKAEDAAVSVEWEGVAGFTDCIGCGGVVEGLGQSCAGGGGDN